MSLAKKRDISLTEICQFLDHHPDFFSEHPEILQKISIPHFNEHKVSSLLEYQVSYLQKQLHVLEKDNTNLNYVIDQQRNLGQKIHTYIFQILQSRTTDELYSILQRGMKKYYTADRLIILVFDTPGLKSRFEDMLFLDSSSSLQFMFTELFHRGKPLCNSLQEEHIEALFKHKSTDIHSTVILPMVYNNRQSLMILGSYVKNRYRHGIELDLLQLISNVVNHQLSILTSQ